MSTLGGRRIVDLHLELPPSGGWLASLHLESGDPPASGLTTLVVGDLSLPGSILPSRSGLDSPAYPSVVVAGGAGWRTQLARGLYATTSGVRLSTVLADLGAVCGEAFDAPPESKLGPSYTWSAGARGLAVLADLVARGAVPRWRVVPSTGRTSFTVWPTLPAADAHGRVLRRDLARGVWTIGLDEAVAAWLPGANVQGTTIARLVLTERASELRAEVWKE